jgi:hypothetical protein
MARRYGRLPSELVRLDIADLTINMSCMMAGEAFDGSQIQRAAQGGGLMPVVVVGGG